MYNLVEILDAQLYFFINLNCYTLILDINMVAGGICFTIGYEDDAKFDIMDTFETLFIHYMNVTYGLFHSEYNLRNDILECVNKYANLYTLVENIMSAATEKSLLVVMGDESMRMFSGTFHSHEVHPLPEAIIDEVADDCNKAKLNTGTQHVVIMSLAHHYNYIYDIEYH